MMGPSSQDMDLKVLRVEDLNDLVCVVVGTRPGIIKQSPVIRALAAQQIPFFVIHTGQHYSYEMDRKFFEDLELPEPEFRVDGIYQYRLHGQQTAEMLKGVEATLLEKRPKLILVGGDANTNLAAALAARKLHIAVGHVEAGLRSFDWRMPEEHNRVMIDHISEYLFAPTENARRNLKREAMRGQIYVVGNTIVDAVNQHYDLAVRRSDILQNLGQHEKQYFLMTVHREENTDYVENLSSILEVIECIVRETGMPIVFPAHPRTRKRLVQFGFESRVGHIPRLHLIDPVGYLDFLHLLGSAALVLTDSGGVQQEACILRVPCITLREATEWVETLKIGANIVSGLVSDRVLDAVRLMLDRSPDWPQPFGDGTTGERIANVVKDVLRNGVALPPVPEEWRG